MQRFAICVSPPQPGLALIGLAIRAGEWIDHVTPIFAELLEDGTLGPEIHGPSYGGTGAPATSCVSRVVT